jgi:hypothetical protein
MCCIYRNPTLTVDVKFLNNMAAGKIKVIGNFVDRGTTTTVSTHQNLSLLVLH